MIYQGTQGDDVAVGTADDDHMHGHAGDDALIAGRGDDTLRGGSGNDYLSGNQGSDLMWGGKGADTFVFDGDFDADLIADFDARDGDRLEFWFYAPERASWDAGTILDFAEEIGNRTGGTDLRITIPGGDESIEMKNVSLADLSIDDISVHFYSEDTGLA